MQDLIRIIAIIGAKNILSSVARTATDPRTSLPPRRCRRADERS
jgi:hypothetical protein